MKNGLLKQLSRVIPNAILLAVILALSMFMIKLNKENIGLKEELKLNKYWYSKSCELVIESANSKADSAIAADSIYFFGSNTGFSGLVLRGIEYKDQENIKKMYRIKGLFVGHGCYGCPPVEKDYERAALIYEEEFNNKMWNYLKSKDNK